MFILASIILGILKLAGVLAISWFLVALPMLFSLGLFLLMVLVAVVAD